MASHVASCFSCSSLAFSLLNKLENQLTRLFDLLLPSSQVASLFSGEHTRVAGRREGPPKGKCPRSFPTQRLSPTCEDSTSSGIASFFNASQTASCLGCRKKIAAHRALCDDCKQSVGTVYNRLTTIHNKLEQRRTSLHAICAQCQGSRTRPVICGNM